MCYSDSWLTTTNDEELQVKKIGTVAAASIGAFAVGATVAGGIAIASADNSTTSTTGSNQQGWGRGPGGPGAMMGDQGRRGPGEVVTGDDAQKAIDAALSEVQGAADHVHKAPDGTYRVMVTTSDNKRVVVTLDVNFVVTDQQEVNGRGPGHGPGTPATEQETQKASDAALAKIPGATVIQVFKRDDGGYAVMLRKDNGRKRIVMLDANYAVESVQSPRTHRGDGPHGPRGDRGRMGKDVVGPAFKKAEAAALAEVANGTVMDVHKVGKRYIAVVKKADDSVVMVEMTTTFEVTGTRDMDFRRGPGPMPMSASTTAA